MKTRILSLSHRLVDLWNENYRVEAETSKILGPEQSAILSEIFAVEDRVATMQPESIEEALIQLRHAAVCFESFNIDEWHQCDTAMLEKTKALVWASTWYLTRLFGDRIPYGSESYFPPTMDPDWVNKNRRDAA